jgi:hypothetical protein
MTSTTTTTLHSVEYYKKEGPVHRNADFPDKLIDNYEGKTTIFELMMSKRTTTFMHTNILFIPHTILLFFCHCRSSFETYKDKQCLGWRPKTPTGWGEYVWATYGFVPLRL